MDPASIIGLVAAACQFAELAAKGAIKGAGLLKSLKNMPAKLAELLATVQISKNNMIQLRDHLAHPTLMGLLPQSQLQSFRRDIDKAYKTAEDLENVLACLIGPSWQERRGIKRFWRDVISLKRESELNEKFETIQRYNEHIQHALIGVQLALSVRMFEKGVAIGTTVNKNASLLAEIRDEMYELNSRNNEVDVDVNVHGSTLIKSQQTRLAGSPSTTRVEVEVRLEPAAFRDNMRHELFLLMTGQVPYANSVNSLLPTLSRMSHEDQADIANILRTRPQQPIQLRGSKSAGARRSSQPSSASGMAVCDCHNDFYKVESTFRRGPFSFRCDYLNQIRHRTSCRYNIGGAGKRTWKYQLCMRLLPLVNETVQFAFSATLADGGLELRFPIRVFPTVERARSEIFGLFDNFTQRCANRQFASTHENQRLYLTWKLGPSDPKGLRPSHVHGFAWDIERVREELRYMHRVLSEAHSLRVGSVRDTDESGFTVLHELIILIIQLIPVYTHIVTEITDLLNVVSLSGIDAHATVEVVAPRNFSPDVLLLSKLQPVSPIGSIRTAAYPLSSAADTVRIALPLLAYLLDSKEQPHLPFDSLLNMMSLDFDHSRVGELPSNAAFYDMKVDAGGFDCRGWQGEVEMHAIVHKRLLRLLRMSPDLTESIFEGDLARIVLDRDLQNLERYLALDTLNWKAQAFGFTGISILDLALGWKEGLEALSAVWAWDATCTFWLAFLITDNDSCLRILDSFFMPMNSFSFIRLMMDLVKADASHWAQTVVKSHVRKRQELVLLGRGHLSSSEQKRLGILNDEAALADSHARELHDKLVKKGVSVPLALHPGWSGSIYCVLGSFADEQYGARFKWVYLDRIEVPEIARARDSFLLISVAQTLFDNGFMVVDEPQLLKMPGEQTVRTPLQRATSIFTGIAGLPLCLWFLQKGANPNFPLEIHDDEQDLHEYSNLANRSLLARLTAAWDAQLDSDRSMIRLLVQYVSGPCSPMSTDDCVCYCLSSEGCLPQQHFLLAPIENYPYNCNLHKHKGNALVAWVESCLDLTDDQKSMCFEQAVRLELFDRLGLIHTCCQNQALRSANQDSHSPLEPEELDRIREDDAELACQLDLLMLAYRGSLLRFLSQEPEGEEAEEYLTGLNCGCKTADSPGLWGSSHAHAHTLDPHTTRLLAHWRHWWTRTDAILADIHGITLEEVDQAYEENALEAGLCTERADMLRALADMRTDEKLKEMGFARLGYEKVIELHFWDELAYARENINPGSGRDGYYWGKSFDEVDFTSVHRPELLEEVMERLERVILGDEEI